MSMREISHRLQCLIIFHIGYPKKKENCASMFLEELNPDVRNGG